LARVIAADGERLLGAVDAATDQPVLAQIPSVLTLRRVWAEQHTGAPGQLHGRAVKDMPAPAELISSYDSDVRYSTKRQVEWIRSKVHFTETCDEDRPHRIAHVETTPATMPDDNMIAEVHESLEQHDRLPGEHWVDKGYTDDENRSHGSSGCSVASSTRRSKSPGDGRRPRSSASRMRLVPGLRGRTNKRSGVVVYSTAGTSGRPRRTCSMF
jgi:hypothetical protein